MGKLREKMCIGGGRGSNVNVKTLFYRIIYIRIENFEYRINSTYKIEDRC